MLASEWSYPAFVLWVGIVALAIFVVFPRTRSEQFWMSFGGAFGGIYMGYIHQDFFYPPSSHWWHAGFGSGFLGMVAALSLTMIRKQLMAERDPSVRWRDKTVLLLGATIVGFILHYGFGLGTVTATAWSFAAGACGIVWHRHDLRELAFTGAVVSLLSYVLLTGAFLLAIPSVDVAGQVLSPYYKTYGPWRTTGSLMFWALAFGAFFAVAHAFLWDKKLVLYSRH